MRPLDHYDDEAEATLRRGMRDDHGIVHAAHVMTAEHVHAGWWMAACLISFRKHEDRQRWTEDVTTCVECAGLPTNARICR